MSLRKARERAGLTQKEAARLFGLAPSAVSQWDSGQTMPRAKLIPRVAEVYGCTVAELFEPDETEGGEDNAETA